MKLFFAGSFDPFTAGHRDIVQRALSMGNSVVVGVGVNSEKQRHQDLQETIDAIRKALGSRAEVITYSGLTAEAAKQHGCEALLRGLRGPADLAYEQVLAEANRRELGIETIFIMATPELAHVSSSLVRELQKHKHDTTHLL